MRPVGRGGARYGGGGTRWFLARLGLVLLHLLPFLQARIAHTWKVPAPFTALRSTTPWGLGSCS